MSTDAGDPQRLLAADRQQARDAGDPNASLCWLATVDATGQPHVRTLVLRDVGADLALFVNQGSPKASQLRGSDRLEVALWLPSLQHQWRITAGTRLLERDVLEAHWRRRPRMSQVMDHLYASGRAQSSEVAEGEVASLHGALDAELGAEPSVPEAASGIVLEPERFERLVLGDGTTLHEREAWDRDGDRWLRHVLVP